MTVYKETMNRYAIVVDGKTVDYLTAENAESAARAYSTKQGPDSDLGFIRGVKMLDANTRGREWAIIETDGGDITARHTARLGGLYVPARKKGGRDTLTTTTRARRANRAGETEKMKLIAGAEYDTTTLTLTGWTDGDGSGSDGYHVGDYFRDGRYLGPDVHGIEPEFAAHRANGTMDAPAAD